MENLGTLKIYLYVLDRMRGDENNVLKDRSRRVTLLTRHCVSQRECDKIVSDFLKDNSLFDDTQHPVEALWSQSAFVYPMQY